MIHTLPLVAALALSLAPPRADTAALLPERTVVYVEAPGLPALLAQGLAHPFVRALLDSELGRAALAEAERTPEAQLALCDALLGQPLLPALARLCSGGAALGVALTPGGASWALVLQSDDDLLVDELLERASLALREQVGRSDFFAEPHLRVHGADVWHLGPDLCIARRAELVVASGDEGYLRDVLDCAAGRDATPLAARPELAAARAARRGDELAWAYVDRARIERIARAAGAGQELASLAAAARSPQVQYLLGPGLAGLADASRYAASLWLNDSGLCLELTASGSRAPAGMRPSERAAAPPALLAGETCASAVLYRDLSGIHARRAEIFAPEVLAEIGKRMGELALLFGGQDVGEELLPRLSPWLRVVSRPVAFHADAVPEIPLPAAALLVDVEDPERTGATLVSAFQTLIGIVNLERAQEGREPLVLALALEGETQITTAHFATPRAGEGVDIRYNLRPACALVGATFVVGTHEALVRELVRELRGARSAASAEPPPAASLAARESLVLGGHALARVVAANLAPLAMQKVLDEGVSLVAARAELDGLRALLELFARARLEVRYPGDDGVVLAAELELAPRGVPSGGSR